MKTYKIILLICLVQVFLSSCRKESPPTEDDSLRVKVYNLSNNYTLKNISFLAQFLKIEEDLAPGDSSPIYKLTPSEKDRGESSTVFSFIDFSIEDKYFDHYIILTYKIINNIYVDSDSVNDTWGHI